MRRLNLAIHCHGLLLTCLLASAPAFAAAPASGVPTGSGPEPAAIVGEASLPTHTIYRPAQLEGLGY